MFSITVRPNDTVDEERTFDVKFRHRKNKITIEKDEKKIRVHDGRMVTICQITTQATENSKMIIEGRAYCSKNDTFSKFEGRRLSLERVLEAFDPTLASLIRETHKELSRKVLSKEEREKKYDLNKMNGLIKQLELRGLLPSESQGEQNHLSESEAQELSKATEGTENVKS